MASPVKSVVYSTIALADTVLNNTSGISVPANSVVEFLGAYGGSSAYTDPGMCMAAVFINGSNAVEAIRGLSSGAITVAFKLTTYYASTVNSITQYNTPMNNVTSASQTLSPSVTAANAVTCWGGATSNNTASTTRAIMSAVTGVTSSAASVVCGVTASGVINTPYYTIVDFKSGVLNSSVQYGVVNSINTVASATITGVSATKSKVSFLGFKYTSPLPDANFAALPIISMDTGGAKINGTTNYTVAVPTYFCVAEYKSADIKTYQDGTVANGASSATGSTALSPTTKASLTELNYLGYYGSSSSMTPPEGEAGITLASDGSAVDMTRGTGDSTTATVGWQAIQHNPADQGNMLMVMGGMM